MFSNQKKTTAGPNKDAAVTILTSGCHFNGKLYTRGSSRIGGKIEGEIISEGLLIVEEPAVITAQIKADEAVIQGTVSGKLEASGRVELTATSRFDGDISTPCLVINEGAQFNGRSYMPLAQQAEVADTSIKGELSAKVPDATPDPNQLVEKQPEVAMLEVSSNA